MKQEKKNIKVTVIILGVVFAVISILTISGVIPSIGNGIYLRWIEHKQSEVWSADYAYFTGTRNGSLHSENDELFIDVETNGGSLEINVEDTDGKLLFSDTITETTSFQIDVPNNIDIEVIGKSHKGGFELNYK